jgi:hypothetical protein
MMVLLGVLLGGGAAVAWPACAAFQRVLAARRLAAAFSPQQHSWVPVPCNHSATRVGCGCRRVCMCVLPVAVCFSVLCLTHGDVYLYTQGG